MHYEFGGVVGATKYIGPARRWVLHRNLARSGFFFVHERRERRNDYKRVLLEEFGMTSMKSLKRVVACWALSLALWCWRRGGAESGADAGDAFRGNAAGNVQGIRTLPESVLSVPARQSRRLDWHRGGDLQRFDGGSHGEAQVSPANDTSGQIYTFATVDLACFITRLRQNGIQVHLGLAFEDPCGKCVGSILALRDGSYPVPRRLLGEPDLAAAVRLSPA